MFVSAVHKHNQQWDKGGENDGDSLVGGGSGVWGVWGVVDVGVGGDVY